MTDGDSAQAGVCREFFFAKVCPFAEECTEANFKGWRCWGWDDGEARQQVLNHLKGSGLHKDHILPGENRDEEYEAAVAVMEIYRDTYGSNGPPSSKKRRGGRGGGVHGGGGGGGNGSSWDNTSWWEAGNAGDGGGCDGCGGGGAGGGVVLPLVPKAPQVPPPAGLVHASSSDQLAALIGHQHHAVTQQIAAWSGKASGKAPITRQDLREVSDALQRCVTSARHAQRLSAMAAKAFDDEAGIFEEVKQFVDSKMALAFQ